MTLSQGARSDVKVGAHLSTTTTGLSDSVTTIKLFQIISAEHTIIARLSTWCANCRFRMSRSVWYMSMAVSMAGRDRWVSASEQAESPGRGELRVAAPAGARYSYQQGQ